MFVHNLNPVFINFGFFEIRWYSLAYIFGIIIGWWLGKKIIKFKLENKKVNFIIKDDSYYLNNPFDIFKIWQGGMSFHGALIGIIIGTYIFSNLNKVKTFFFLDVIACVAPIGLFFGRIANFINAELYGKPTSVIWSVIFPNVDNISRHPSQLYEAILEGLVLFVILIYLLFFKKNLRTGIISSLFLIFYGTFRIFAEYFREPDKQLGYILDKFSLGTILSAIMILIGTFIFLKIKKNEEYK